MFHIKKTTSLLIILCLITFSNCWASLEKVDRLSEKIHSTNEQKDELEIVCDFIKDNWETWMNDPETIDERGFSHIDVTDQTYITVHPSARDVIIFTEGHTKMLGAGVFKRVLKAISYVLEEEVAVAAPHSYYNTPNSNWNLSSFFSTNDFFFGNSFLDEATILEKVQGCRSVIQIYFISFHYDESMNQKLPVIVGKYYNGKELYKLFYNDNTLSMEERLLITHDLLLALSDVHARNIVHNDLHGGNVLLEKDPTTQKITGAFLADFGLSKYYEDDNDQQFVFDKLEDEAWLFEQLIRLFSTADNGLTTEELIIMDFLTKTLDSTYSIREAYHQYVTLLPTLLDQKTQRRITANANIAKRVKIKQPNIIKWIPRR